MTPQLNSIIAAERRADAQRRVAADRGTARRPLGRWLTPSSPRLALPPAPLECCA